MSLRRFSQDDVLEGQVSGALLVDFAAAWLGALALVAVDALFVARGFGGSSRVVLSYVAVGAALSAWAAGLGALLLAPARVLGRGLRAWLARPLLATIVTGLCAALFVLLLLAAVLRPWELDPTLKTYLPVFVLGCGVLLLAVALFLMAHKSKAGAALSALVIAVLVEGVDRSVLGSVYPRWHQASLVLSLAAGLFAAHGLPQVRKRALAGPLVFLALGCQAMLGLSTTDVVELGAEKGRVVPRFVQVARFFADRDGDRFSRALGGGDCDDGNPHIFPGQCEVVGNGSDDNCNGLADGLAPAARAAERARTDSSGPEVRPDVYFVLVDGLRADFAGKPASEVAPDIERFTHDSLRFLRAYATYASTFRSVTAMLASRHWRYLGSEHPPFLVELSRYGWQTEIWIRDERILDIGATLALGRNQSPFYSRRAGKEHWTKELVDHAISELAKAGGARARFIHLLDTHMPWVHAPPGLTFRAQYQAEITHVAAELGRFFEALGKSERGRRAVVVLFADHGAAFGEHGSGSHGGTLYEELVRVPLVMRLPGVPPRAIEGTALLLDVVPTLAHYLGLPSDPDWQGFDWLEGCEGGRCTVRSEGPRTRVIGQLQASADWSYAGLPALQAVTDGRYKLIVDLDQGRRMLMDLERDPTELAPLVDRPPEIVDRLERALAAWEDLPGCANRL